MTGPKLMAASAVVLMIWATPAASDEPAAFQAQYPNRDVLNGGALTPAGRLGLLSNGTFAPGARLDSAGNAESSAQAPEPRRRNPVRPRRRD